MNGRQLTIKVNRTRKLAAALRSPAHRAHRMGSATASTHFTALSLRALRAFVVKILTP